MKISVVMQSYLGDYPGSRKDSKNKFVRAVSSFLRQTHEDKELVIVSDGCEDTKKLYKLFKKYYEEVYLNLENAPQNIFVEKLIYNFMLPYYIILLADRLKEYDTVINMFKMIFKNIRFG